MVGVGVGVVVVAVVARGVDGDGRDRGFALCSAQRLVSHATIRFREWWCVHCVELNLAVVHITFTSRKASRQRMEILSIRSPVLIFPPVIQPSFMNDSMKVRVNLAHPIMFTSHSHRNVCSYPRPTSSSPFPSPAVAPEPFIPLQPPPSATPPSLPRRPSLPPLPVGWKRTQHALHAAYPRTFEASTGTLSRECNPFDANPLEGETKDDRKERAEKAGRTVLKRRVAAGTSARADDGAKDQHGLWIAAEKWQRTNTEGDDGLTLVMTHANGFTKEVSSGPAFHPYTVLIQLTRHSRDQSWHPTLTRLINLGSASPGATFGDPMTDPSLPKLRISDSHNYNVSANAGQIDTVWLLDDVHHGASIDLNAGKLGPIHNWSDGGRDVISAIEQVMSKDWARNGKVIGVGHSVGGNALWVVFFTVTVIQEPVIKS